VSLDRKAFYLRIQSRAAPFKVGPGPNPSCKDTFGFQDLLLATGAVVVDSIDVLAKMRGMKGVVIQDNIHDDKTIGKLS